MSHVPDRECRDDGPQLVMRRKHPGVQVPMLPGRRHQIGSTNEELAGREFDDAVGPWP